MNINRTKKAKVKATPQTDPLVSARIVADYEATHAVPIRPFDLRHLGYFLDPTEKVTTGQCELRRVLDEDTKREASFSYLLWPHLGAGAVLPHPYSHFIEGTAHENNGGSL